MNSTEQKLRAMIRKQLREEKKVKSKACEPQKYLNDIKMLRADAEDLSHRMSMSGCEEQAKHIELAIDALDAACQSVRSKAIDPMSEPSKLSFK